MSTRCVSSDSVNAGWRNAGILLSTIAISAVAGSALLALVYGPAPVLSALTRANRILLVLAAAVGVVMLLVRAQRAAILLSRQRPVRPTDAYSAMVVGNGLGDLIPLVPCGVALRCFLTERLSHVSVAFAAGVFLLEGTLDGLALALLSGPLALALRLPSWLRVLLLTTLVQAFVSLAVPVAVHLRRRSRRQSVLPQWMARLGAWGGEVGEGLAAGLLYGRGGLLPVTGLSLLITALAGFRLVLFLSAFGLSTAPGNVLLVLVLTLAAGNLPLNLPGSGTVTTAVALQVAGIHGAGAAGFVLVSRAVPSGQVMLMACGTLAWWTLTGSVRDLRVGTAFQSLYQASWSVAVRRGHCVGRALESIVSGGIRGLAALAPQSPTRGDNKAPTLPETNNTSSTQIRIDTIRLENGDTMHQPFRFLTAACLTLAALSTVSVATASAHATLRMAATGPPAAAPALKSLQWYLKDARVYGAWTTATTRGAGVRICSVDTGVSTIPDLAPSIVAGANLVDVTKPTTWTDDEGHGTFTSSEMVARGAVLDGVAPGASLIVAKALAQDGSGGYNTVNGGILYCVAQGAKVINLSLGGNGAYYDGIAMAIRYACAHGVAIAAAAGNAGTGRAGDHPAAIVSPCLIAVNAADAHDKLAGFSNWDENAREVTAGGVNVIGESPSGPEIDSGTSMASPLVAGTLALEMGQGVDATTAVRDLLATARKPAAAKELGSYWHRFYGAGMLDAKAAVKKAAKDAKAG